MTSEQKEKLATIAKGRTDCIAMLNNCRKQRQQWEEMRAFWEKHSRATEAHLLSIDEMENRIIDTLARMECAAREFGTPNA